MKAHVPVLILAFILNGCQAGGGGGYECSSDQPVFVWPLRFNSGVTEILNNTSDGLMGDVTFMPTSPDDDPARSSAMEFAGTSNSFATLPVPYNDAFLGDYTIQFYAYFDNILTGTILHYQSDYGDTEDEIEMFHISVLGGNIVINIIDYGSVMYLADIRPGEWTHIMYERDISEDKVRLNVNRTGFEERTVAKGFYNKPTKAPGILYLGGNLEYFTGKLACLQIIPCTSTISLDYDNYCNTTLATPTTESIHSSASTTNGWRTSTTSSTTWSVTAPTESTTITPFGTPPSTQSSPQIQQSTISTLSFPVENSCSHFTLMYENVAFYNTANIIDTATVKDIAMCTKHCNTFTGCITFTVLPVVGGYECHIGSDSTSLIFQQDSMFYERV